MHGWDKFNTDTLLTFTHCIDYFAHHAIKEVTKSITPLIGMKSITLYLSTIDTQGRNRLWINLSITVKNIANMYDTH